MAVGRHISGSVLTRLLTGLCITMMAAGTGIIVWLYAAPQYEAYRAETQFTSAQSSSSSLDPELVSSQMSAAEEYNASLNGTSSSISSSTSTSSSSTAAPYEQQLNWTGGGEMSWLEIPAIDTVLPIYHGDSDEVLMQGLGHLPESSLPIGGESTHCLITGHSGMPRFRMFDDLDKLREGDVFVFWTLGEPYAYRVYDIEVVLPEDSSSLYIQRGRDLATLITCTPYGINDHRLLVHGERTDYTPEEIATAERRPISDRLIYLVGGSLMLASLAAFAIYLVFGARRVPATVVRLVSAAGAREQTLLESKAHGEVDLNQFGNADMLSNGRESTGKWRRVARKNYSVNFDDSTVAAETLAEMVGGGDAGEQVAQAVRDGAKVFVRDGVIEVVTK